MEQRQIWEHLPQAQKQIEKRQNIYRRIGSILDKKAQADNNYGLSLQLILQKQVQHPSYQQKFPHIILFNKLVSLIQKEASHAKQSSQQIKKISQKLNINPQCIWSQNKKLFNNAVNISKDVQQQIQKINKNKIKYQKKHKENQQAKIQYLCSYLGNQQLQRKNELYLSLNSHEQTLKPLRQDLIKSSKKFNDHLDNTIKEYNNILQKLQIMQQQKIKQLKNSIVSYLKLLKQNTDYMLEVYPFDMEEIDRVKDRQNIITKQSYFHSEQMMAMPIQGSYIDTIYERMEVNKNLQQLILYGQSTEHKRQLADSFNGILPEWLCSKGIQMVTIFKEVFQGQNNSQIKQKVNQMRILFKNNQQLRKNFILCLQKYRINSEFKLKLQNKDLILRCLTIFLDICHSELDTYNSKLLMILSLTYHFLQKQKKVQLQQTLSHHAIWKSIGWWQAALLQSIFQETKIKMKKQEAPLSIWDLKAGGITRREQGEEQTYQHICFNQILYYIKNMGLFHLEPETIHNFANLNIKLLKFTGRYVKDILQFCPQLPLSPSKNLKRLQTPKKQ